MNLMGKMVPYLLQMLGKKTETVLYPAVKTERPEAFRGALRFYADRCVGCKLCQRVCPSSAITIEKVAEKQFKAVLHLEKCIFCGQCTESCKKNALENTDRFELASADKASLKVEL